MIDTEMQRSVKGVLSEKRYEHTIRVVDTAIELAQLYNVSVKDTKIAALLHDYAKCFPLKTLEKFVHMYELPIELLDFHHELWHGPVAAALIKDTFSITNEDILNAIRYHTTGRAKMTRLEYIIFVADYIEPARSFPGVEEVRALAKKDLERAARKALQNTIIYLMKMDMTVHPNSYLAYNYVTEKTKGR